MFKKFTAFDQIPKDKQDAALELKDGSWVLPEATPDSTAATESIARLERSLAAARQERNDWEAKAKQAESSVGELTRKLDAKEATGQQTDEKITAMLAKWEQDKQSAVEAAIAATTQKFSPLQERLTRLELDDQLGAAFGETGGRAERKARALVLAKQDGWTVVDGKLVLKDSDGNITNLSPKDYFATKLKADVPEFFEGTKASGGGATGSSNLPTTTGGKTKPPTQWTADERRSYIEANGPEAYREALNTHMREAVMNPTK
jgi:hypothetical protein